MIVVDTSALVKLALADDGSDHAARLSGLLSDSAYGRRIGVPAPVMAEYLVRAGKATQAALDILRSTLRLQILPFDLRAAIQCAELDREALASGDKRGGSKKPWQQVKVDRQVLSIAIVNNATLFVVEDIDLRKAARLRRIEARSVSELAIPPDRRQTHLAFSPPTL